MKKSTYLKVRFQLVRKIISVMLIGRCVGMNGVSDDCNDSMIWTGSKYWKLDGNKIAAGYPRSISKDWVGLPDNIDAAFTWTNGKTYFFKGSRYWRFTDFTLDTVYKYPKDIKEGFAGIPADVDSAFVWSGNGKIYFFKGLIWFFNLQLS